MLFSEPKIPQSKKSARAGKRKTVGFSALQRAENSTIKIIDLAAHQRRERFSALQRAENSSIQPENPSDFRRNWFQCSSASRKFLNRSRLSQRIRRAGVSVLFSEPKIPQFGYFAPTYKLMLRFSALQRAENSSMGTGVPSRMFQPIGVSVLFSEPKIPQCRFIDNHQYVTGVSVLFSEPKIPQSLSDFATQR